MFFMNKLVSWDYQRAFLAVIEEGSLSRAARRLGVSQPTVRSWITSLEEALDTKLFSRSVNGLVPTESARALVEPARAMSLASDYFVRAATAPPGEIAGTVRVSVSETMGVEVIPPMLVSLRRAHPQLTVELYLTNRPANLLAQEVDIAVRTFPPEQDALIARKVGAIPLGFFASVDYLERRGWPETAAELVDHDILGPDRSVADLRIGNVAVPDLRPARYALRTDSHPARIAAARAGLGITVLQVPIGSKDQQLRRVFPDVVVKLMETWIVAHEDLRSVAKVGAVFDHLVSGFIDFIDKQPLDRLASSAAVSSPFRASSATFALNSGACCFRFDISDLLLVEDQQTANRSLRHCPNFGGSSCCAYSSNKEIFSLAFKGVRQNAWRKHVCSATSSIDFANESDSSLRMWT